MSRSTSTKLSKGAFGAFAEAFAIAVALMAALLLAGMPGEEAFAANSASVLKAGSVALKAQGNSTFQTARVLQPNTVVTAKLDEYGASNMGVYVYEDWYKLTLPKKGLLQVRLSAPYVGRSFAADPWVLELRASSGKRFWSGTRPDCNGNYTLFTMGLPAGTYYLALYTSSVPNVTYQLSTNYFASTAWESEPANDAMATADALALNATKSGSVYGNLDMGSNTDKDWYRVRIAQAGVYNVRFGAEYTSRAPSNWYLVRLYSGSGNWLWDTQAEGDNRVRTVGSLKLSAGTYYVKVEGARYMDAAHYELTVSKANVKAKNTMAVKGKTASVKYSKVKRASQKLARSKVLQIANPRGTVTCKKVSGNKKLAVSKSGKVTVKKGLKRGTYTVKVKVTASGNSMYKALSKTVSFKVRVK